MNYRQKLNQLLIDHRAASTQVKSEQKALIQAEDDLANSEEAQKIIQYTAQTVQQKAHDSIAGVVSRCLESIFDDPYKFKIEFERKRGRTEAKLIFLKNGIVFDDPLNQIGGGVNDVAAFALRLACIILNRPPKRRVIVLDEPFKDIRGKQYRERVRSLVLQLSEELGIQFILNIDLDVYPEFALGKVIEIEE